MRTTFNVTASTVWRRLGLWRATRTPLARALYERLTAAGVHVGRLDRFVRDAGFDDRTPEPPPAVDEIRIGRAVEWTPDALATDPLAPGDLVVTAERDGRTVGYGCLSDRPVYVPALDRRLSFPGAYVWRVHVEANERGRGIGTALIRASVDAAANRLGVETVSALVAPDNVPSRRAFTAVGFASRERYTTLGVGGLLWMRGPTSP